MGYRSSRDMTFSLTGHSRPFIIAELSANHNGSYETAKEIISLAYENGANAIKLQTYNPDTITLNSDLPAFTVKGGTWDGRKLYDLYSEGAMPWEWQPDLIKHAKSLGLYAISSVFDEESIDFLSDCDVDALKIASFELTHVPLIKKVAISGYPIIVSTGMASMEEVKESVKLLTAHRCQVALLHCVSSYPASVDQYNIRAIQSLRSEFNCAVGISDHCLDPPGSVVAVALGATIIEKHFTRSRLEGGLDSSFSIEPSELLTLRKQVDQAYLCLGSGEVSCNNAELESRRYRRSIYTCKSVAAGERFSRKNIKVVRPGHGLHPRHFENLLGKVSRRPIPYAHPITAEDIEDEVL